LPGLGHCSSNVRTDCNNDASIRGPAHTKVPASILFYYNMSCCATSCPLLTQKAPSMPYMSSTLQAAEGNCPHVQLFINVLPMQCRAELRAPHLGRECHKRQVQLPAAYRPLPCVLQVSGKALSILLTNGKGVNISPFYPCDTNLSPPSRLYTWRFAVLRQVCPREWL
jgi:hypothetical protein